MKLSDADSLAEEIIDWLAPYCKKIQVAGSVRRRRLVVKDIEILAEPLFAVRQQTLFGDTDDKRDLLGEHLHDLLEAKKISRDYRKSKDNKEAPFGPRYYRISWEDGKNWQPVDIFSVYPPADWFTQLVIRTGPAEFSHYLVTVCKERVGVHFDKGHIEDFKGNPLPCSKEEDVFTLAGVDYMKPEERDKFRIELGVTA